MSHSNTADIFECPREGCTLKVRVADIEKAAKAKTAPAVLAAWAAIALTIILALLGGLSQLDKRFDEVDSQNAAIRADLSTVMHALDLAPTHNGAPTGASFRRE
jgi:hypothetical protein